MCSGECTSIDSLMGSRAGGPGAQGQGSKCGGVETRDRGWRETLGMVWKKIADDRVYSARQSSKWVFVYT